MDAPRFDRFTRTVARSGPTRRRLLAGLGSTLAIVLARFSHEATAAKCVAPGRKCRAKKGRKKCCGAAKCRGKKCKCPAGREACGKQCCPKGQTCQGGTCVLCDVCPSGCAFSSLQVAVDAAAAGATIRVCPGTYTGRFTIARNLTLVGAGAAKTILDGLGALQVLSVEAGATAVILQHLTVTRGNADTGGGIISRGRLILDGVSVAGNTAVGPGAGIVNLSGTMTLLGRTTVTGNSSGDRGGGIANVLGTLTLQDGSRVTGNTAATTGGGIDNFDGTVTLQAGSAVMGNTASGGPGSGGGIYTHSGTVTVPPSSVTGNTPDQCAGMPPVMGC